MQLEREITGKDELDQLMINIINTLTDDQKKKLNDIKALKNNSVDG